MSLRALVRRLARAPGFTAATVLPLAIGIGATTAIFSVVNGILLKPLPFFEPDRLIALRHQAPGRDRYDLTASPAIYFTYREHNITFESVALYSWGAASVTGGGDAEEVQRVVATHELLPTLGVRPLLGRTFTAADDEPGSAPTVVLSHGYWQRRFGGAADVIGRTVTVDGAPHEVIGVLPQQFRFMEGSAEIYTSARLIRAIARVPSIGERAIARLKPGVTLADASADVERMIPILFDTFPLIPGMTRQQLEDMRLGPNLRFLKQDVVGDLADVLWVLMGTIGLLLLAACANVANLELVRTEARTHELAIRTALGAGWSTLARSLLGESLALGVVGGALGLLLAVVSLPVLLAVAGAELPSLLAVTSDWTVLLFAAGVSIASGLLFGSVAVAKYSSPRVAALLGAAGRGYSVTRDRQRVRDALVVLQIALALVLLVGSGLMIRTFQSLRDVDPGFTHPDQVQTFRLSIPQAVVPELERVVRMQNDIEDRLNEIAGVESAGFSTRLPVAQWGPNGPFLLEDRPDVGSVSLEFRYVSPDFFTALGTPLLAGRDLAWSDYDGTRQVAVVSAGFARRAWGSPAAALGKRLRRSADSPWVEIVGVVGDLRQYPLEQPPSDTIYLTPSEPLAQFSARSVYFFVRSDRAGTSGFLDDVQQAVSSVDAGLPLGGVQTLGDVYRASMARTSLTLVLLGLTGGMAFLLGLVGVYGVISYLVANRTRELGIRIALGAPNGALQRMLLGRVLLLVGVALALGLGGAAGLARLMSSLLFGVTALDPATYVAVAAALMTAAVAAGYLPTRRVTRIDPTQALRHE